MAVLRVVVGGVVVVMALGLLEPKNQLGLTLAVYVPLLLGLSALGYAVQRGAVRFVGWVLSLTVWGMVSAFIFLLGGLEGHNAAALIVAVTIAGTLIGGHAALVLSLLSGLVCTVALVLQLRGLLPQPIAPVSGVNSFIGVITTLIMSGWLLTISLSNLRDALSLAQRSALERDLASERLRQSERLETIGRLSAGVAHDLNNVLSVVRLSTDVLNDEAAARPELKAVVEDLLQAADQATLLTRRLLAVSRGTPSAPELLEVGLVVEQFSPLLRRLLPEQVTLNVTREAALETTASRSGVELILLNLVVNARDAMPRGGVIDVRVKEKCLSVTDQGEGVAPDVLPRLFTPFFTTKAQGTGLGLANVAEMSAAMNAKIEVSSPPGEGATFTLRFGEA